MDTNPQLELAYEFLQSTAVNLFLTGRAGTGKTTFLHQLHSRTSKRMIIVAPTGVAAINAGGTTIHSFFQLPFGVYIAGQSGVSGSNANSFKHRFSREKINIIRSIDLLVIDEISMVRADLLDALSDVLCRYRDRTRPFGGVQLLMIGDLQQLAPVTKDEDWTLLKEHYDSPFFFASKALRKIDYIGIELLHVYRQSDDRFIHLLNQIREGRTDSETLRALNTRYIPGFRAEDGSGYITLTSHNYQAQQINRLKMDELPGRSYTWEAEISGEFPELSYPTDTPLTLKHGAQVMFVKNDSSPQKRYYNGKIGRITSISKDEIVVECPGDEEPIIVEREQWTNTKYAIDPLTREITERVEGMFTQYPLKSAWAITIHKSQGLTFERAVVDAGSSFTHGQVYVALSRCKTMEGLVLASPLRGEVLISDSIVRRFNEDIENNRPTRSHLDDAKRSYYASLLRELFDFTPLLNAIRGMAKVCGEHLWRLYPELTESFRYTGSWMYDEVNVVGERFASQLERLVNERDDYANDLYIAERIAKARVYFNERIERISALDHGSDPEVDSKESARSVSEAMTLFRRELSIKIATMEASANGFDITKYLKAKAGAIITTQQTKARTEKSPQPKNKAEKSPEVAMVVSDDIIHPELYEALRTWRHETATEAGLPSYVILSQKALIGVCNNCPTNKGELLKISGIGKVIAERYGAMLLDIVRMHNSGI